MAIKIKDLNTDDIYYRSYNTGKTGKCKYVGYFVSPFTNEMLYKFKFIQSGYTINTTKYILENRNIWNRVKKINKDNQLKSW